MTILTNGHQWKFSEFLENKNYSFNNQANSQFTIRKRD